MTNISSKQLSYKIPHLKLSSLAEMLLLASRYWTERRGETGSVLCAECDWEGLLQT